MSVLGEAHERVFDRRVRVLVSHLSQLLSIGAAVLDVGCGDGTISRLLMHERPDLKVEGVDVLVRPNARIQVREYDGRELPYTSASFDEVIVVDVVHHANDPDLLVRELERVARKAVIIKDHNLEGVAAFQTLRFMDWVGNDRHGVSLPYNYWSPERWREAFADSRLLVSEYRTDLGLYPLWADWVFGRGLHFLARLEKGSPLSTR